MRFLNALLVAALIAPSVLLVSASPRGKSLHRRTYEDDKDKDGGLLADYSTTAASSTPLISITLPAKDRSYSALSDDKTSFPGDQFIPVKDGTSSAPLEKTSGSVNVPISESNKDSTVISKAIDDSSHSSTRKPTEPTASTLPETLDEQKPSILQYPHTVSLVNSKDEGSLSVTVIFSTSKDKDHVSSSPVTASYDKPSSVATSGQSDLKISGTPSKAVLDYYDTASSASLSESLLLTIPDKDKANPTSLEKDDETSNPSPRSSTASNQHKSSSELLRTTETTVTFPPKSSTSQSLPNEDNSASNLVSVNEKPYPSFLTPILSAPDKDQGSSLQRAPPVSVPAQNTIPVASKALEVASTTSAPKQEQTVRTSPTGYQKSYSSSSLISTPQETYSRNLPDEDKTIVSSQVTSSPSTPDEGKTSASLHVTPTTPVPDKDKTPGYSSANDHISSSERHQSPSSSLDRDQTIDLYINSKDKVTISRSPSKDQPTGLNVLSKDQTTNSDVSFNYKQTSSLMPEQNLSPRPSRLYDSKTISASIQGSLLYAPFVTLGSTLTATDSIATKDHSFAVSTATHSLSENDKPTLTPSTSIAATYNVSVPVTSSPSMFTQNVRESIISKILLSFGISTPPKDETLVTAFINDETPLFPTALIPLSGTVTMPALTGVSTEIASLTVTSTDFTIPLITPKPETLTQTRVPYPSQSLVSTSRAPFLNTSVVIPVWTPAMLGNAYGGGYITTPSVFVTSFPNSPKSSKGIPPGYELTSKSEGVQPPDYVPTPVAVKVEGSTTAYSDAGTPLSAGIESKDQTSKPGQTKTPSFALKVEESTTAYPGASSPPSAFTETKDQTNNPGESKTPYPGAGTSPSAFTELKDQPNKPGESKTPSFALKVEGSTTAYPGAGTPFSAGTESKDQTNNPGESATPYPGAGSPFSAGTESKDQTNNPGQSKTPSFALKVEGSTTAYPGAGTPPSAFTESKDRTKKPGESATPYPGAGTSPSAFTESKDQPNKPGESATPYPGAGTPPFAFTQSKDQTNKPGESKTPSIALKVEENTAAYPGADTPTTLFTESKDKSYKPSDSLASPVTNKAEGITSASPRVETPITDSKIQSNKPSNSQISFDSSPTAEVPKDQTSERGQAQAGTLKSSNGEQLEDFATSGPSALISDSRLYNSASPSAESNDLGKSTVVTRFAESSSDDLPGKTLVPSQPSSVRSNDKADKTSDLTLVDIPISSKVTLLTTTVPKDKTDGLRILSLPPSAGASIARISHSPLKPEYNASSILAYRPTSPQEFEGLASKDTMSLSWGLIVISALIFPLFTI